MSGLIWVQTACKSYQQMTLFCCLLFFKKSMLLKNSVKQFVSKSGLSGLSDLGPNCLEKISAEDTSRQRVIFMHLSSISDKSSLNINVNKLAEILHEISIITWLKLVHFLFFIFLKKCKTPYSSLIWFCHCLS